MRPLDPRLVRRSRTVRRQLAASVVLGLVAAVALIAQARIVSDIIARRFADQALLALPIAIAACLLLRAAVQWGHAVVSARAAARVKAELREEIVADLLDPRRLGPRPESSRVLTLLGPGLDAFDRYVGRFLPQLVLSVLVPGLVLAVVAWTDWLSAVIIGVTLPLIVVFMALVGLVTRDRVDRRWKALERLGRHFADVLDGLVVLKVFGRRQEQGLREVGDRHRQETLRALRLAFLSSFVLELFSTLAVALVAVSVGLRVVHGDLALDPALFVLLLAPEAFAPIRQLGAQFHDSTEGAEAAAAVLSLLEHDRASGTGAVPDLARVDLVVDAVVVRHVDRTRASLRTTDVRIRPGELVAVTGESGAGKSTLLSVLLAFERPSEGRVLVGDTDLTDLDPVAWREQIAWVPQLPGLVDGSIGDNVRLSCAGASRADVLDALRDAGAADLAVDRPISESGDDISAGERRRLAVARAVVRVRVGGARLLLLDEPTAGLDADREERVLTTLRDLDATVIVVTHRPETILAADRVLRLETDVAMVSA
jgi:ATP-binding cassette, subfamily C, bacterial CydD